MITERDANKLYAILKPEINKYLKKYKYKIGDENIKELTNDIYLNIYSNLSSFPKEKKEISKYIYITCRNHLINFNKIKKIDIKYINNEDILDSITEKNNNIEDDYIIPDFINYNITHLNGNKKIIFKYKMLGYSLNEISKITKISKTHVYRLFNQIKEKDVDI